MIKALFFDLDGTLLTSSKRISDKTIVALRACRSKGIKVFAATSRPPLLQQMLSLTPDEREVLQDGGIFFSGGCISIGGQKQYTFLKKQTAIKSIETILRYPEVNFAIQMSNEEHSFRYPLNESQYAQWGISRIIPFDAPDYLHIVKLVIFSPWSLLHDLQDKLTCAIGEDANIYFTGKNDFRSVEVIDKTVNKKLAIEKLLTLSGFSNEEAAVFGDDNNDIEMLEGFRHSFAMGNACDKAKQCAAHVIPGNDEDGIYYALKNILKLL